MKPTNLFLAAGIFLGAIAQSSSQTLSIVQFTALTYSMSETGGVGIITVERIGEPGGTASVAYSTSNRTATDGEDYTEHFGSLVFNGETNLTIAISILDDAVAEGNETVLIELFNPLDTVLGERRRAVLVIRDDDSPQAPILPLTRWHEREPLLTSEDLSGVVYGNGRFVAVGEGGSIVTSEDGLCWFLADSGRPGILTDVAYGNGLFVAVGPERFPHGQTSPKGGVLLSSPDGMHWIETRCAECGGSPPAPRAVTYGNGLFVAVGSAPSSNGWEAATLTSTNGLDWRREYHGVNTYLADVAYGNGTFLAIGGNEVLTSSDGRMWHLSEFGDGVNDGGILETVVYGNGRFGLVKHWGCIECFHRYREIFSSSTGTNWTLELGFEGPARSGLDWMTAFAYGDDQFVAVRGLCFAPCANELILSADLTASTTHAFPFPLERITSLCVGNHTIVGVGAGGLIVQSDPLLLLAPSASHSSTLDISGPTGSSVRLEAADSPAQTNAWQVLGTLSLTNSPQAWTDPQATNSSNRFYRAVLLP